MGYPVAGFGQRTFQCLFLDRQHRATFPYLDEEVFDVLYFAGGGYQRFLFLFGVAGG